MQTIWSRAAQAPGHHCPSSLRPAQILARRTATTPTRRKATASDVFTACYSAIMASAAVIDAARRDKRRKEIDKEIEEARDGLARFLELSRVEDPVQTPETELKVSVNVSATPGIHAALMSICERDNLMLRKAGRTQTRKSYISRLRRDLYSFPEQEWVSTLRRTPGFPPEEEWWRTPPNRMDEVEKNMLVEESSPNFAQLQREPVNEIQLSRSAEMINQLVDQLLAGTYTVGDGELRTPDLIESAWNAVRMLRSDGYPDYRFPGVDAVSTAAARADLNTVNRNILRDWGAVWSRFAEYRDNLELFPSDKAMARHFPARQAMYQRRREYFIGKICHNLLIAETVPGIQNYNALLTGFAKIGEVRLAQAVVDSFLFHSRMKPTPMTLAAILHHYRLKNDLSGFYSIIRRLTGEDYRGIGLRTKTAKDVRHDARLFNWARRADIVVNDGFVTERATIDEPLLEALFDGLIDFDQIRQAATLLAECLREGLDISATYIHRIVALCVYHLDKGAALKLLPIFIHNVAEVTSMITSSPTSKVETLLIDVYKLVYICEDNADRRLALSLKEAQETRVDVDWSYRLQSFKNSMWLAFALARVKSIEKWTRQCHTILTSGNLNLSRLNYLHGRLSYLTRYDDRVNQAIRRFKSLVRIERLSVICRVFESKVLSYENQLLYILVDKIPKGLLSVEMFDADIPLADRLRMIKEIVKEHKWLLAARDCVVRSAKLEEELKWTLLYAMPRADGVKMGKVGRNLELDEVIEMCKHYISQLKGNSDKDCFARAERLENDISWTLYRALPLSGRRGVKGYGEPWSPDLEACLKQMSGYLALKLARLRGELPASYFIGHAAKLEKELKYTLYYALPLEEKMIMREAGRKPDLDSALAQWSRYLARLKGETPGDVSSSDDQRNLLPAGLAESQTGLLDSSEPLPLGKTASVPAA